jgi:hypothetical protein
MMPRSPEHRANYSLDRRAALDSYLRAEVAKRASLSREALVTLAVGLFICNETGSFTKAELTSAMQDASVVAAAHAALRRAGL